MVLRPKLTVGEYALVIGSDPPLYVIIYKLNNAKQIAEAIWMPSKKEMAELQSKLGPDRPITFQIEKYRYDKLEHIGPLMPEEPPTVTTESTQGSEWFDVDRVITVPESPRKWWQFWR